MNKVELKPTGTDWLVQRRADVNDQDACLLVQGYPATGFWVISEKGVFTPPDESPSLNWDLYWDLRLFGDRGEWHLWRTGAGAWAGRLCASGEWSEYLDRNDALWGTRSEKREVDGRFWTRLWEERGATVWVPGEATELPVRLKVRRHIGYQPETGLAGFVDAMILGFRGVKQ